MSKVIQPQWFGCYDSHWRGLILPEAFAHPAKFSRGLIERIFDYCLERGYLKRGDVVADCFGGIASGGIVAAYRGLHWVGCELEPKFVALAEKNIELHRDKLARLGCVLPVILQGDSRRFSEVIKGAVAGVVCSPPFSAPNMQPCTIQGVRSELRQRGLPAQSNGKGQRVAGNIETLPEGAVSAVVTSPPFVDSLSGKGKCPETRPNGETFRQGKSIDLATYGQSTGQIATLPNGHVSAVITSPPYATISAGAGGLNTKPARKAGQQSGRNAAAASQDTDQKYGDTPGQIAGTVEGNVDAVITSPPYADSIPDRDHSKEPAYENRKRFKQGQTRGQHSAEKYGDTDGQIGKLTGGQVDGVITSPPYEDSIRGIKHNKIDESKLNANNNHAGKNSQATSQVHYGDSDGQLGKASGETYWQAMALVYAECFKAIRPGGVILVVVKDYVKNKKRVPLCDDTTRLLEHVGFVLIERIHAMLVSEKSEDGLFGDTHVTKRSRKSFFRRLAEKKGSPEINFEEVIVMRRPA